MKKMLSDPIFEEIGKGFMVTVFAGTNKKENVIEKKFQKEILITKLMEQNRSISASEIAITLKLSERTVQRYIKKLVDENMVKRIGSDKSGYWEVVVD